MIAGGAEPWAPARVCLPDAGSVGVIKELWTSTPVVVSGLGLPSHDLAQLRSALGGAILQAIDEHGDAVEAGADEHLERFVAGNATWNVVESYLVGEHFEDLFPVPAFIDDGNLLCDDERTEHYRRSLVLSPSGYYTPRHADSGGLAGWLYLDHGLKEWEFARPEDTADHYDPLANDYYDPIVRPAPPAPQGRLDAAPTIRFVQGPGELVIIPPGSVHRVWTTEPSWGWGGRFLDATQIDAAVDFHRFERPRWGIWGVDLYAIIAAACDRQPTAPWAASARARLAQGLAAAGEVVAGQ